MCEAATIDRHFSTKGPAASYLFQEKQNQEKAWMAVADLHVTEVLILVPTEVNRVTCPKQLSDYLSLCAYVWVHSWRPEGVGRPLAGVTGGCL